MQNYLLKIACLLLCCFAGAGRGIAQTADYPTLYGGVIFAYGWGDMQQPPYGVYSIPANDGTAPQAVHISPELKANGGGVYIDGIYYIVSYETYSDAIAVSLRAYDTRDNWKLISDTPLENTTGIASDLTGAVSVMDMKDPISENSGNILNSMAGKLPGVNVIPDAAPGGTGSIRVRGMSTANSSNDPLYIIDGVPTDNLNCFNPADIESMQVLKDAASASIYGSRAANGVVIITTKQGKGDRMTINVNYAASAQTIAKCWIALIVKCNEHTTDSC